MTYAAASSKPEISDTGLKGFLKWYQREQPEVYKAIAPALAKKFPRAFSDYNQSLAQDMRHRASMVGMRGLRGLLGHMGDDTSDSAITDITFDSGSLAVPTSVTTAVDTADAANSGSTDSSTTSWLSSLIGGLTQGALAVNQVKTAQQVTQLQLQRAQAGLPPLNIDMGTLGVPTMSVGLSSGTQSLLMYIALGAGALLLLGGLTKSRAK